MVDTLARPDQRTDIGGRARFNRARIWTMVVACMGVSLVIASMVALNTALRDVAVATSATQTQLTWIVDCYTVVLACLLLPAGAIGDRYGRRGALLFGLATFAVASLASTVFDSPVQLIAARGVAGAGAAFIMPATLSLLTASHREDERAKAAGIWAGVAGCGAVIGMLGSGMLLHFCSWRSIFWAFAGSAVLIFVLACTVASSRDEKATPLDWPGAASSPVLSQFSSSAYSRHPRVAGLTHWSMDRCAPGRCWRWPSGSSSCGGTIPCSTFGFSADRTSPPDRPQSPSFSWPCSDSFSSSCNTSSW